MSIFIVELNSPYRNWLEPEMQFYFSKMVQLKRSGYEKNYPAHYLPVDTSDFIGVHHLICRKNGDQTDVIAGFKTLYLRQCDFFKISFPAVSITARTGQYTDLHLKAVTDLIANSKLNGTKMIFGSSWTIQPDTKNSPELVQMAKELTTAILFWYQTENDVHEGLALGVVKARTDLHFGEQGYVPIRFEGIELPTFKVIDVDQKEVRLMHRKYFTEKAALMAEKYQDLWKNRLVIGSLFGVDEVVAEEKQVA